MITVYYHKLGGHYHMRVFVNHAKSGDLCVRVTEWDQFRNAFTGAFFVEETEERT